MHAKNEEPRARRWTQWVGPALTALIAALSQGLSNTWLRVPNPPAFLVLSIVFSAFQGGLASGLLSAVVAWAYIAFFFSNPGQPFVYTDENLRRVIVWAVTMPATASLVGVLQHRAGRVLAMTQSHAALQEEIAERQRTEAALRESEAMFQALFEFAPDAIVAVNRAGNIVRVNAQAETMFGYRQEELHGQPVERLLPERFTQRHARHRAGYVAEPRARPMGASLDLYGRRKDGREFPADITLGPLETNGDVLVLSVIRDITERKWAEREIRLLQTITVAISQAGDLNAGLGIALRQICETTGWILGEAWIPSADGSALECSPAWHGQVAGLEKFRAASEGLTFLPGAGFPGRVWVSKQPVWAQDVTTDLSFHRADLAREAGLKAGVGIPVVTDGDVMAAMIFFAFERRAEDERLVAMVSAIAGQLGLVIQRRRADEALARQAEELRRSNAELEQFAYVASHDLQEPLRGIAGTVQLLQQRYGGKLDARADEFITHAVEGAARMQALINDLLAYSRVGTRGRPFTPADCAAVLAGVLADLNVALQESGAVVTHAALPSVRADATQLMQLFQNLIANAVKFRGERPPEIHVGAERGAGEWVLSVRDNGIGIEPQYFERVFGVFQRLHTRREYPGTGIGLAICKKIVERHGGRIWVESQPGQGSTFYFTLPDRK